jgi:hypothetical protein
VSQDFLPSLFFLHKTLPPRAMNSWIWISQNIHLKSLEIKNLFNPPIPGPKHGPWSTRGPFTVHRKGGPHTWLGIASTQAAVSRHPIPGISNIMRCGLWMGMYVSKNKSLRVAISLGESCIESWRHILSFSDHRPLIFAHSPNYQLVCCTIVLKLLKLKALVTCRYSACALGGP